MRVPWAILMVILVAAPATAEFGDEDEGYPVNEDGQTIYPYIPEDLAEAHPEVVAQMLAEPRNKVNGYTAFPYYPILTAEMQRLAEEHPDIARLSSAGKSRAGLDLWVLEIADFDNETRKPLAEREVIYLDGGTHSNEYSGVYFVTEWAQFLLDEYETNETAQWIVQNRHTFILPMVNPDGSNAFGRLNALTVNINRNFPATWGAVDADRPPMNWPGPYPASEPETQAVIGVMKAISPDYVNSIHCCGNLWLHPYGAEHLGHAPDLPMYNRTCINVFADLTVGVERRSCGETWSTIYPASGTTLDEGYALVGASSWSYEMSGRGAIAPWGQPVVDTDVREQETESWRGVMHAMLHTEKYGANPRVTSVAGTPDALTVTVLNDGWGELRQGTLAIGAQAVSLPTLAPGQEAIIELTGDFDERVVPVDMTWAKRIHPESNWGKTHFALPLELDGGKLTGTLPTVPEAPDMSYLLPEVPADVSLNLEAPGPLVQSVQEPSQDAPGAGLVLLGIALLGVALARRR